MFMAVVAGRDFALASEAEFERVKQACVAAARRGGDIVPFDGIGGRRIELLVTPGIALTFERVDVPAYEAMPAQDLATQSATFGLADYMS
jgi:hypothetical protein